jgi:outer membrane protein OmpA-like peptidoglycan-associated protein
LHNTDSETIIRGYTDSQGDYNLNKKLSRYRADIVKSYLVTKGIANSRIKAIGLGSQNPIADNITREGRSKNRRVEINVKM